MHTTCRTPNLADFLLGGRKGPASERALSMVAIIGFWSAGLHPEGSRPKGKAVALFFGLLGLLVSFLVYWGCWSLFGLLGLLVSFLVYWGCWSQAARRDGPEMRCLEVAVVERTCDPPKKTRPHMQQCTRKHTTHTHTHAQRGQPQHAERTQHTRQKTHAHEHAINALLQSKYLIVIIQKLKAYNVLYQK